MRGFGRGLLPELESKRRKPVEFAEKPTVTREGDTTMIRFSRLCEMKSVPAEQDRTRD